MRSLTLLSPAKLNLLLRVVGRYPNGYHKLVTLFHRISLADTLRLRKRKQGFSLQCSYPGLPVDERNLIAQAYRLLQKKFPALGGVSVSLTKRIPVGGGLGGGSSNAAMFLLGMKKLYRLSSSQKDWIQMGKKLGADVPFFLSGVHQAIGRGRGDQITSRPARKRKWFVLVLSPRGLSTKKVYENLPKRLPAVSLTKVSRAVKMTCDFLDHDPLPHVNGFLENDLRPSAVALNPRIRKIIAGIHRLGISWVSMSGSGPTVFAVLSHQQEAKYLRHRLRFLSASEKVIICHSF